MPVLVRLPLVVAMTEPMVVLPAPVTVSARVAPVMPPVENVSVPASDPTVVLLASTMAPVQALALARLRMAPGAQDPGPGDAGHRLGDDEARAVELDRGAAGDGGPARGGAQGAVGLDPDHAGGEGRAAAVRVGAREGEGAGAGLGQGDRARAVGERAREHGRGVAREAARQGHGARGAAGDRAAGHARDRAQRVGEAREVERGAAAHDEGRARAHPVGDAQLERARGDRGRPGVRVGDREQQRPRPRLRDAAGTRQLEAQRWSPRRRRSTSGRRAHARCGCRRACIPSRRS